MTEEHESPMLSLDKTKDREVLREFIGEHKTLLSWKLDGLTIVITDFGAASDDKSNLYTGVWLLILTTLLYVFLS